MGIGKTLREAREARGLTLEEISQKTKIRRRYLEAIENEKFDILPGHVYVKGFIRNYARFVGLDPEPLVALLDEREAEEQLAAVESVRIKEEKKSRIRGKPLVYIFFAAVLCLAAFGIYAFQKGSLPQQPRIEPPASGEVGNQRSPGQVATPPSQAAEPRMPPVSPGEPQQKGVNLVLNVVQDRCWMRVVVDGETMFTGELTANQSRSFSGKERIEVKLGNAGVVQVEVNGRNLGYLGEVGDVITKEFVAGNED